MEKRGKNKAFYKDAVIGVLCVVIYSFVFFSIKSPDMTGALEKPFSNILSFQSACIKPAVFTLAPTLRIKPMVDIEKQDEGYVIVERDPSESAPLMLDLQGVSSPEERARLEEGFQDDVAFMYLCHLIARSLEIGITEQGLKDLIEKHLSHVDFKRFLWQKIYKSGKMFHLPYVRKDTAGNSLDQEVHILKFYLDDGSPVAFPDQVLLTIGKVKVILEDPIITLSLLNSIGEGEGDVADEGVPNMLSSFADPSGALPANAPTQDEMIQQARSEFNELYEEYGWLERAREVAHKRDRNQGYYAPGYAYYELRLEAEKLRNKMETWRIKWAKGFGVDKELRSMVEALDEMSVIIRGTSKVATRDIYYQLNGPFNALSVYLLNAYSEVGNTSFSVDAEKFVVVPSSKTMESIRDEFEEFYYAFQRLKKNREGFSRLEGNSIYDFRTVWKYDASYAIDLAEEVRGLKEKLEVWNVMWGERVGVHAQVRSVTEALADIEKMCRGRDLYSHGTVNLRELNYRLNMPINKASVSFLEVRHHEGWLSAEKEITKKKDETLASLKEEDLKEKTSAAMTFIDTLRLRAFEAKGDGQKIIIGFDTSWIPGLDSEQGMAIQSLLSEIYRLTKADGLENIIVVRGKGAGLASTILKRAQETGTPLSNVVVLGSETTVQSDEFFELRSTDTEKKAFLAGVNPKNLTENSYIRVLEMLTLAVKLAFGEIDSVLDPQIAASKLGPRLWIFIPEAEPFDFKELKQRYDNQFQALVAA